jgi:hypothetical protein
VNQKSILVGVGPAHRDLDRVMQVGDGSV